jgi:hypothetical protein
MQGMLITAFVGGLVMYLLSSGSLQLRLALAVVTAVVVAAVQPLLARGSREDNLRKVFRERFGGSGPFSFDIELLPAGVVTVQAGTRAEHPWSKFVAVEESADAVELVGRGAGTIVVRNRAFATAQERAQFVELARRYLASK